jgi:hypothetical protein
VKSLLKRIVPARVRKKIQIARRSTYCDDGLITSHNSDFLTDPLFVEAYRLGKSTGSWGDSDLEWRAYVACWAANRGKSLDGDFVECGVNRGGLSRTVMHHIGFKDMTCRKFYLLDTFCGFPESLRHLAAKPNLDEYRECYQCAVETFKDFSNVVLIRGQVPETLNRVSSDRLCYLSLDMNCAEPEIAAAEFFWDKLVGGAVILLDDYGYSEAYRRQKQAFDNFAKLRGVQVLLLPTGQGLIVKPQCIANFEPRPGKVPTKGCMPESCANG